MSETKSMPATLLTEVDCAERFLLENYELRRNVLSNKLEVRHLSDVQDNSQPTDFRPTSSVVMNTLFINARRELSEVVKNPKPLIQELIMSDFVPDYDPIQSWLNSLAPWDNQDRIDALFKRIPGVTPTSLQWLHTWFLSAVAHWLQMDSLHGNECVPTLIGPQGCGKSTFCQRLLPPHLREYYLDHLNLSNKFDKEMALTNNLLVNLDEIDKYKPSQQANLKQTLSKTKVNGRPIYGREQHERPRYASFVATTNNPHPLQDPTGSRRYICILIPDDQLIDNQSEIQYEQLYAQALYELQTEHRRYWFDNSEVKEIQSANTRFQHQTDIDEMITDCLSIPAADAEVTPMSVKQIVSLIQKQYPLAPSTQAFKISLGRQLIKHGFKSKSRNTGSVYFVVPRTAA